MTEQLKAYLKAELARVKESIRNISSRKNFEEDPEKKYRLQIEFDNLLREKQDLEETLWSLSE